MTTLTFNSNIITALNQKLKTQLARLDTAADSAKYAEREAEITARLNELIADAGDNGTALVDTSRELQTLRANREKQAEKIEEITATIGRLKFLLADELAKIDIDERHATLEDFGL